MRAFITRICLAVLAILAILPELWGKSAYFRSLSEVGKLGDMTVSSIVRDSLGYVWFGTRQGVERFDGIRIENYPLPAVDGKSSAVKALCPAGQEGRVVAGKEDGLWLVDPAGEEPAHLDGDALQDVTSIVKYASDTLLVGSRDGLYLFILSEEKPEKVALTTTPGYSVAITDISREGSSIWVATDSEIFELDAAHLAQRGNRHQVKGQIRQIVSEGEKLFVGTHERGLLVLDKSTGHTRHIDTGCNVISSIESGLAGNLYVGTDGGGIVIIDKASERVIDKLTHSLTDDNSINSNSIYSLHVDNLGQIWAGFYQLGADYTLYQNHLFEVFKEPYYDSQGVNVRVAAIDGAYVILGTRDGLVIIDRDKQKTTKISHPLLRSNLVISLLVKNGNIYVGTYGGGLSKVNLATGAVSDISLDGPFRDGHIFAQTTDPLTDEVWTGTSQGLYRVNDGQIIHYNYGNSHLPDGNVYNIFFDSTGRGWISTATGMALWDRYSETLRTDMFPHGFFNWDDIRDIYEDASHRLYFVPDKGLPYYSDINMKEFGRFGDPVLSGRDVKSITGDANGYLWVATNNGVVRWNGKDEWIEHSFIDGLPSQIFNTFHPVSDGDGNLWFGNTKGLLKLNVNDSDSIVSNIHHLPAITRVVVKGEPLKDIKPDDKGVIHLPEGVKDFDLEVSSFTYTSPQSLLFDYQLEGVDAAWRRTDRSGVIPYYDLAPGVYTLRVRDAFRPEAMITTQIAVKGSRLPGGLVAAIAGGIIAIGVVAFFMWRRNVARRRAAEELERKRHQYIGGDDVERVKYKSNRMSVAECERISGELKKLMETGKPYVNPDLTLADLAMMIDVSTHKMSYYFSQYLHQSYYDYINTFRVNEFKRMATSGEASRYTLSALSAKAGFSSRASFFRYFKKSEGITPAQYMKELE